MVLGPVKFGVSPIAWSNDDLPSLGGDTPLEQCLQDASDIGFDGIELGGKFPRDAVKLAAILQDYQLKLASGWFSGLLLQSGDVDAEKARIGPHLSLLSELGCSEMVYADVSGSIQGQRNVSINQSPKITPNQWHRYGQQMTELADFLAENDMTLAYHHHMGTIIEDGVELDQFMAATGDNVKLTLDTGHAAMASIDPVAVINQYFPRIAHVHLKDLRSAIVQRVRSEDASFLDGVVDGMFTVPGDGALDFAQIINALDRHGYAGWIIIEAEQDPERANPHHYSKLGLDHIKSIIANTPSL